MQPMGRKETVGPIWVGADSDATLESVAATSAVLATLYKELLGMPGPGASATRIHPGHLGPW